MANNKEKVYFNRHTSRFMGLTEDVMTQLHKDFPDINIPKELNAMEEWLLTNPKGKRCMGTLPFITSWLDRAIPGTYYVYPTSLSEDMKPNCSSEIQALLTDYLGGIWTKAAHVLDFNDKK